MKSTIIEHFGNIPDPRVKNKNFRHNLIDIIFVVLCAGICMCESWEDVEEFGRSHEEWLKKYIELPNGIPSHDTFSRVMGLINPVEFRNCFINWVKSFDVDLNYEIINIDGKTVRRSFDKGRGKSAIHVVSAWANNAGISLGQLKVNDKTNEITAIPELLDLLEIEGSIVTIDAIGCQKKIAKKVVVGKNADYLFALKGNQGDLRDDVESLFKHSGKNNFLMKGKIDYFKEVNKEHGRLETRQYWCTSELDWLSTLDGWSNLNTVCMVKSEREINGKKSADTRYYISSLKAGAEKLGNIIRKHWGIENSLHWVLDVSLNEDQSRKRWNNSAENYSIVRHCVLNLLKREKTCNRSIKGKRLKATHDVKYLEKVLWGDSYRIGTNFEKFSQI